MKWQVIDKKHNSAKNKTQEYNITLEATEDNNIVEVKVTVPACPRGQRPVAWHTTNVSDWLREKGYDIASVLQSQTITDASTVAQTGTYSFSLKQTQNKVKQTRTNKTKKNSTKSSADSKTDRISKTVTSALNTDTE